MTDYERHLNETAGQIESDGCLCYAIMHAGGYDHSAYPRLAQLWENARVALEALEAELPECYYGEGDGDEDRD